MLPPILIAIEFLSARIDRLKAAASKVHVAVNHAARAALPAEVAAEIRAVATNGTFGLSARYNNEKRKY